MRRLHCDFLGLAGKTNTVCGKRVPVLLLTRYGAALSQGISCWHQGQAFPALVLVGLIVFLAVSEALFSALREDSTVPWRSRVDLQAFLYVVCGVLIVRLATGVYDYVKGTVSPPVYLSHPSYAIVTRNTGHTKGSIRMARFHADRTEICRALLCRVQRYLLRSAIMVCLMGHTAVQTYVAAGEQYGVRSRLQLVLFMRGLIENSTVWIATGGKHHITSVLFQRCFLGFGVDRGICSTGGDVLEETPVAMHGVATLAQYKLYSYKSVCDFGVPCDCSLKSTAFGQCDEERLFLDFEQLQSAPFSAVSRHLQAVSRHHPLRFLTKSKSLLLTEKSSVRKSEIAPSCTRWIQISIAVAACVAHTRSC